MKIKSITRNSNSKITVDIQVANTHSYQLENGCVVHNTISKIYGLTEGWHLPSMVAYLRYVQFRNGDPLINKYNLCGYPFKQLKSYEGTTVVGFPTKPELTKIMPADQIVTAADASMEEQYKWIQLGEKYWLFGGEPPSSDNPATGNQISYTAKYKPAEISLYEFKKLFRKYQQTIACCSVMPQEEVSSYEYQPETPISVEEYDALALQIERMTALQNERPLKEDVDKVHVDCAGGACPVDFNKN